MTFSRNNNNIFTLQLESGKGEEVLLLDFVLRSWQREQDMGIPPGLLEELEPPDELTEGLFATDITNWELRIRIRSADSIATLYELFLADMRRLEVDGTKITYWGTEEVADAYGCLIYRSLKDKTHN